MNMDVFIFLMLKMDVVIFLMLKMNMVIFLMLKVDLVILLMLKMDVISLLITVMVLVLLDPARLQFVVFVLRDSACVVAAHGCGLICNLVSHDGDATMSFECRS